MGTAARARLDALMEFPGTGDLSLTRAIVRYQEGQVVDGSHPSADDLGIALVIDGEYAAAAEAIELGSGRLLHLDLSTGVVILDWVYPSTLDYVRLLLRAVRDVDFEASADDTPGTLRAYCETITPPPPPPLRLGFRDILRDLDPHEEAAVRIQAASGDRIEVRFDCDANALVVVRRSGAGDSYQRLLASLFPGAHLRGVPMVGGVCHQLRYPAPFTLDDARAQLCEVRDGLLGLVATYEPERYRAIRQALDIFGPRDTLAWLERDVVPAVDAYLTQAPAVVA